jgi:hypothetical protein
MKYKDKFTEVSYWELDWHDFEQIVQEVYSVTDYDFVSDVECYNDSEHSYSTDLTYWDSSDDDTLKDFVQGKEYYSIARVLIQDLARKELIPKGNILISVSW